MIVGIIFIIAAASSYDKFEEGFYKFANNYINWIEQGLHFYDDKIWN